MQKIMKSVTRWIEIRGIKMRKPAPMIRISIPVRSFLGENTGSIPGSAIAMSVPSRLLEIFFHPLGVRDL